MGYVTLNTQVFVIKCNGAAKPQLYAYIKFVLFFH